LTNREDTQSKIVRWTSARQQSATVRLAWQCNSEREEEYENVMWLAHL